MTDVLKLQELSRRAKELYTGEHGRLGVRSGAQLLQVANDVACECMDQLTQDTLHTVQGYDMVFAQQLEQQRQLEQEQQQQIGHQHSHHRQSQPTATPSHGPPAVLTAAVTSAGVFQQGSPTQPASAGIRPFSAPAHQQHVSTAEAILVGGQEAEVLTTNGSGTFGRTRVAAWRHQPALFWAQHGSSRDAQEREGFEAGGYKVSQVYDYKSAAVKRVAKPDNFSLDPAEALRRQLEEARVAEATMQSKKQQLADAIAVQAAELEVARKLPQRQSNRPLSGNHRPRIGQSSSSSDLPRPDAVSPSRPRHRPLSAPAAPPWQPHTRPASPKRGTMSPLRGSISPRRTTACGIAPGARLSSNTSTEVPAVADLMLAATGGLGQNISTSSGNLQVSLHGLQSGAAQAGNGSTSGVVTASRPVSWSKVGSLAERTIWEGAEEDGECAEYLPVGDLDIGDLGDETEVTLSRGLASTAPPSPVTITTCTSTATVSTIVSRPTSAQPYMHRHPSPSSAARSNSAPSPSAYAVATAQWAQPVSTVVVTTVTPSALSPAPPDAEQCAASRLPSTAAAVLASARPRPASAAPALNIPVRSTSAKPVISPTHQAVDVPGVAQGKARPWSAPFQPRLNTDLPTYLTNSSGKRSGSILTGNGDNDKPAPGASRLFQPTAAFLGKCIQTSSTGRASPASTTARPAIPMNSLRAYLPSPAWPSMMPTGAAAARPSSAPRPQRSPYQAPIGGVRPASGKVVGANGVGPLRSPVVVTLLPAQDKDRGVSIARDSTPFVMCEDMMERMLKTYKQLHSPCKT